ncbi:hypothetical protein Pan97_00880 [Bremerella volcania]|uniref:Uncharacterized protein n=1 Tax=Bremerella volcania TaxID=2527984 RepID=A0A518C1L1_9BACT|nr:hypothetical protein [Bremerella volcania]QDU73121.1 hypothetical protein Pan97_00880 [Bremerella volcania]
MNDVPPVTGSWRCPTWWQWLVIVWLVVLNVSPYCMVALAGGSLSNLHWVIWSLLSGPFALIGMLSFLTVAGRWPVMVRRLLFVAGSLLLIGGLMLMLEEEIVGASAWFLLEAVVIITLTLLSCRVWGIPERPSRWSLQFSLAEIAILCGLAGIFLFFLRLAEATDLHFWSQAREMPFVVFAFLTGVHLVPVCLSTIATSRRGILFGIGCSVLQWGLAPLIFLAILTAFNSQQLGIDLILMILYPVLGFQALLVWGTLFPIRIAFPRVLLAKEAVPATAAQCKSDTLADAPANCRQSEHTDVPD